MSVDLFKQVFNESQGDITRGARTMYELGLTEDNVVALTNRDIDKLYQLYVEQHEEAGIPISDREAFGGNVLANLMAAASRASQFGDK